MFQLALRRGFLSCQNVSRPSGLSSGLKPFSSLRFRVRRLTPTSARLISRTRVVATIPNSASRQVVTGGNGTGNRALNSYGYDSDTIYALSSAQGRAGVAVIRISGPACLEIYRQLCPKKKTPAPRCAAVRTLYDPETGAGNSGVLDSSALVLHFPGPKTVTGEDVLELHVHGGPATVKAVLSAIPKCSSGDGGGAIRYAEPGEFTRRAFFNGRLDLAQVESLSDALDAETEQQRKAAVRGSSGALGRTYESWASALLLARGEIEALIDFSEDQHFDESTEELLGNVVGTVRGILDGIARHEMAGQRHELLRHGIRIALLGPPNVGKSSLMNLIVGREASIVSTEAGTTRDIVEASLDIRGYLCTFADTAGFRSSDPGSGAEATTQIGVVEREGIKRARSKALDSDVIVVLASIERTTGSDGSYHIHYDAETLRLAAQAEQRIVVINKREALPTSELKPLIDRFRSTVLAQLLPRPGQGPPPGPASGLHPAEPLRPEALTISCKEAAALEPLPTPADGTASTTSARGASHSNSARPAASARPVVVGLRDRDPGGIHALVDDLVRTFSSLTSLPSDMQDLFGVTERQRQLLARCRGHLEDFMAEATRSTGGGPSGDPGPDVVLAAEHLRYARNCLAAITGRGESGDVEEVLGVIFEKFCVGK